MRAGNECKILTVEMFAPEKLIDIWGKSDLMA